MKTQSKGEITGTVERVTLLKNGRRNWKKRKLATGITGESGITLIVLVVTIIILLILAGISYSVVWGENSIIKTAQDAANKVNGIIENEQKDMQNLSNMLNDIIGENQIGGNNEIGGESEGTQTVGTVSQLGETTWANKVASVQLQASQANNSIEYQINSTSGNWEYYYQSVTNLHHGDKVYARAYIGEKKGPETIIEIKDTKEPIIQITSSSSTTNQIQMVVNAIDNESGVADNASYRFSIKQAGLDDNSYEIEQESSSTIYSRTGLKQGTSYIIKIEVQDIAGNKGVHTQTITTKTIEGGTQDLQTGAITATTPQWNSTTHKASITLSTNTTLEIEWQKNNITEGSWTRGTIVPNLEHGDTVFARLTDGTNHGNEASVGIKDTKIPQSATIIPSSQEAEKGIAITVAVTHIDNESGIVPTNCRWVYKKEESPTSIGTTEAVISQYMNSFTTNSQEISLTAEEAGTYYLHVLSVDIAGNKKETISEGIEIKLPIKSDGSFSEEKGVNTPNLGDDMIPIKWNGKSWENTTGTDPEWYDYTTTDKKWANAKTSDGNMWVWIPRFGYQITTNYHTKSTTGGEINIRFLQGTTNIPAQGSTITWNNRSGQGNWNIHPAFVWGRTKEDGTEELYPVSGIWIAKFEASFKGVGTTEESGRYNGINKTLQIKPGVISWRNITVDNIYNRCLSYKTEYNSHMMKNMEWGACAYLAQSSYGKNSEVSANTNSTYYTGGGSGTAYITNAAQSTTGNVWGIYDMNGGAFEYLAAYLNNGNTEMKSYASSLVEGAGYTKDVYDVGSQDTRPQNYLANSSKYGDAVYETTLEALTGSNTGWYGNSFYYLAAQQGIVLRGGTNDSRTYKSGIFYLQGGGGRAVSNESFRPVLIVPEKN